MGVASPMYSTNDFNYQGMEDTTLFEQFPMDYFDGLDFESLVSDGCSSYHENPNVNSNRLKQNLQPMIVPSPAPTFNTSNNNAASNSLSSTLISFDHSHVKLKSLNNDEHVLNFASSLSCHQGAYYEHVDNVVPGQQKLANMTRNSLQAQDHVLSERRRREKLNQKFIALSSIIPGLKKMDKASVLGDAIEYVKQLKERQRILEEQVAMRTKESAVVTRRRSILFADNDNHSPPSDEVSEQLELAEIEARVLGKDVLIRIQCDKHKEHEAKILRELQKLRLTVQSSSILPFGETTLCITMIAQMEKEKSMTAKDLVGSLRKALTLLDGA